MSIARHLLQHRVVIARPASAGLDDYGNPAGGFVLDNHERAAFVQQDGKTEVRGDGDDTVIADYSVFLAAEDGPAPDEACELRWVRAGLTVRALSVLGVREEQGIGRTHHLRVLCKEAPAPTDAA